MGGLEFVGLELLAVFPIHDPLAGGFQMLARRNRSRAADDRHQVLAALDLHLEDGKPILGVVVGDSFDEAGEGFGQSTCDLSKMIQTRQTLSIVLSCVNYVSLASL